MRLTRLAAVLAAAVVLAPGGAQAAVGDPGSLDRSFSGDGRAVLDYGSRYDDQQATDVLPLPSGKTVVVSALSTSTGSAFGVARLRANGTPDPHFSANGRRTTTFTGNDAPHRVVSLGDGRILVAGSAGGAFGLVAYQHDGSLDPSFGTGGKVVTDVSPGADRVLDLRREPDGSILAAGIAGDQFATVRYDADGSLDHSFGAGGVVLTTDGFPGDPYAVRLAPDGKLLATGMGDRDSQDVRPLLVSRYDVDGSLDQTFGGDGRVTTVPQSADYQDAEYLEGDALLVDPEGRVLVGGELDWADYSFFCLVRYLPDGTLDASFADDGLAIDGGDGYYAQIRSLAQQADGKIVAAGWTDRVRKSLTLAVLRYTTTGERDTTFSGDGDAIIGFGGQPRSSAYAVAVRGSRIVAAGDAYGLVGARTVGVVAQLRQ
ncbi:hypothetical protein GCM10009844_23530 [Nocardioides koreensis]|uniref:Delta-60 repeat domain-containing protein n=1 Tax=Nocardioides koreensis TaxID=433651 RepID=A0ABP5LL20_9ACTN